MKRFSLDEYLKNPSRKVITRDGRKERIICTDAKNDYPIVALIETSDGKEMLPCGYKTDGTYLTDEKLSCDLFFAPEKHEGWINIYRDTILSGAYYKYIYPSEEDAKENACSGAIATVKIEWEE